MGCPKPSTCICQCTVVDIVKTGYDPARVQAYPVEDTGCRCRVAGAEFVEGAGVVGYYEISMWVSDAGVLYVSVIFSDPLKPVWTPATAYVVGDIVRTLDAPSPDNYICVKAGTSGGSEPTWNPALGIVTTDNDVEWQRATEYTGHCLGDVCTGKAGVPGELTCTTITCYSELLADSIAVQFPGIECFECPLQPAIGDTFSSVTDNGDGTITFNLDDPTVGENIRQTDMFLVGPQDPAPPTPYDGEYPVMSSTPSTVVVAAPFLGTASGNWFAARELPSMNITITASGYPDWSPNTAYAVDDVVEVAPPVWQASTAYPAGSIVSAPSSGDYYQATVGGTSDTLEPIWQELIGEETFDATITWVRVENTSGVWMQCTVPGTSGGAEPTWNYGGSTNDNTVVWFRTYNKVVWCNQTWYLPAQSGESRLVCATGYNQFRYAGTGYYGTYYRVAKHIWRYGFTDLEVGRNYAAFEYGVKVYRYPILIAAPQSPLMTNLEYIVVAGDEDLRWCDNLWGVPAFPVPPAEMSVAAADIQKIVPPVPYPTQLFYFPGYGTPVFPGTLAPVAYWDAYTLTADWFGSHTINGILYSWEKGLDWPVY